MKLDDFGSKNQVVIVTPKFFGLFEYLGVFRSFKTHLYSVWVVVALDIYSLISALIKFKRFGVGATPTVELLGCFLKSLTILLHCMTCLSYGNFDRQVFI